MDHDGHAQSLTGLPQRVEPGFGKVVTVDVGSDLDAVEPDVLAPLHLLDAQVSVLHRQGAQPHVVPRVILDRPGHVVIEEAGDVRRVLRLGPISKEHGNGAHHLHLHAGLGVFLDADYRVPAVGLDFLEEAVALHHAGRAFLVVLEVDEGPIPQLAAPIRQLLRHDVGVRINLEHRREVKVGDSCVAPDAGQVG